jgi:NitT/TauT family transport system substrate-binding protein
MADPSSTRPDILARCLPSPAATRTETPPTPLDRRTLLLGTAASLGATLAAPAVHAQPALLDIKMTLAAPFDGSNAAFFLAEERGRFREAGLRPQFDGSGGSGEAVTRVGSGAYDFGVGDINVLMEFNARNPATAARCVYMLYYRSPLSGAVFTRSGITAPAQLAGKRVTITNDLLRHEVDYTPYGGMAVQGCS